MAKAISNPVVHPAVYHGTVRELASVDYHAVVVGMISAPILVRFCNDLKAV